MSTAKHPAGSAVLLTSIVALVLLAACNVDVKKNEEAGQKKVDIETPIGGLHVSGEVDVHEIGLAVYPGARPLKQEHDNNEKSANVNISTTWFGLKVRAQEYESDDPPDKLLDYYQGELKKYGKVLRCQTSWHGAHGNVDIDHKDKDKDKDSRELTCDSSHGDTVELKVGTKENQHIVAVEPQGKGSKFALVYVQVRDREGTI